MPTPRSVEFQENILVLLHDFLVAVGDNNSDRTVLLLGNGFGLDAWLNFAIHEFLDKGTNFGLIDLLILVKGEFLVLDGLLDCECRPLVSLQVEVACVSTELLRIYCGEIDGALVFLSNRLELDG